MFTEHIKQKSGVVAIEHQPNLTHFHEEKDMFHVGCVIGLGYVLLFCGVVDGQDRADGVKVCLLEVLGGEHVSALH